MKEPYYAMKLMALWMALNDLECANNKRDWKENGFCKSIFFFYKQPFGMQFRYMHQDDDQNNRRHAKIYIEKHGQKSSGMTRTLLGTWQCQLSMPILLMDTFKRGVN